MEQDEYQARFFDFNSPDNFFFSLRRAAEELKRKNIKETDRLAYLVMGLTHLREWIAPNYNHKDEPTSAAEVFYRQIFEFESFKIIQALCNRNKHMSKLDGSAVRTIVTAYDSKIDDWPDFDLVMSMDNGPPTGYFVNGKDLLVIVDDVIDFYDSYWFSKPKVTESH